MLTGNPEVTKAEVTQPRQVWIRTGLGILPGLIRVRIEYGPLAYLEPFTRETLEDGSERVTWVARRSWEWQDAALECHEGGYGYYGFNPASGRKICLMSEAEIRAVLG